MGILDVPGISQTQADSRYQFLPPARIAFIGDSITAFGLNFPRSYSGFSEPDWFRWLGGISYNMPTGAATLEFRVSDNSIRWTAPGDTAGAWTPLHDGHNWIDSGTTGVNNRLCLGIRMDMLPLSNVTYNPTVTAGNRTQFATAFWNNLQILTGHKLKISGRFGIGGDRSRHVLSRINQVFSYDELGNAVNKPGYVCVLIGTNDIGADSLPASAFVGNYDLIVDAIVAQGCVPILCTIPARTAFASNTTYQAELWATNKYIRDLAASDPRIILIDMYNVTADPALADASAISGYLYDNTHPSNVGAFVMGKEVARVLLPHIGGIIGSAPSRFNGDPVNLQPNGVLQGTSGTSSNPPGGAPTQQVATGYTVSRSSGTTLTISATKELVTGESDWQVLTCASAAAGDQVQLARTSFPSPASLGLAAGDIIYAACEINVSADTGLRRVDCIIQLYDTTQGINISSCGSQDSSSSNNSLPSGSGLSGLLETPTVVIPSSPNAVTQIRVYVRASFNAGGSAVIKVRNINLIKV